MSTKIRVSFITAPRRHALWLCPCHDVLRYGRLWTRTQCWKRLHITWRSRVPRHFLRYQSGSTWNYCYITYPVGYICFSLSISFILSFEIRSTSLWPHFNTVTCVYCWRPRTLVIAKLPQTRSHAGPVGISNMEAWRLHLMRFSDLRL